METPLEIMETPREIMETPRKSWKPQHNNMSHWLHKFHIDGLAETFKTHGRWSFHFGYFKLQLLIYYSVSQIFISRK